MRIFWIVFSFLFFISVAGEPLLCKGKSKMAADGLVCECEDGDLHYSAIIGDCLGLCNFYGDVLCGYFSNNIYCIESPINATEFTCNCPYGYKDAGGWCIDDNVCPNITCNDSINEACVNLVGDDQCGCKEGYYRENDGTCAVMNHCLRRKMNMCSQECKPFNNGTSPFYSCSCRPGYNISLDDNTKCILDNSTFSYCECGQDPSIAICAQAENGTKFCYPRQGYQLVGGSNEDMEDINECAIYTYQCERGSVCSNVNGSYDCNCNVTDGYKLNVDLRDCVKIKCTNGKVLLHGICVDPCDPIFGFECPINSVCVVDEQITPSCKCQLGCQVDGWTLPSNFSIYHVYFQSIYQYAFSNQDKHIISKSMEHIFGVENAEFAWWQKTNTGPEIHIDVGVSNPVINTNYLKTIIMDLCYPSPDLSPISCILPGGVVINISTFAVEEKYPCEEDYTLCSFVNADCDGNSSNIMPGTYQCLCKLGYQLVYGPFEDNYCKDINECLGIPCDPGNVCVNNEGSYSCIPALGAIKNVTTEYQNVIADKKNQINLLNQNIAEANTTITSLNSKISDEQRKTAVVGGVVGALLGVAILLLIFMAFVLWFRFYIL